jgi:Tol biopolymer transport system component
MDGPHLRRWVRAATLLLVILVFALAACSKVPDLPAPGVAGTIAYGAHTGDVQVVRTDGTVVSALEYPQKNACAPAWSPDAARVAYTVQHGDGRIDLVVANADGSGASVIPSAERGGTFPAWSPDGTQLAFSSLWVFNTSKSPAKICVMNPDGSGMRRLTEGPDFDMRPQWAPDGQTILFVRKGDSFRGKEGDVFSVRLDGSGLTQVTHLGQVSGFSLSPDGSRLAVADRAAGRIVVLPYGSGGPSRTLIDTDYGWKAVVISWSPDGKALALGTGDIDSDTLYPDKVVVVNADGSGLSAIPGTEGCEPAWRPL